MNANEIVRALRNCGGGPEGMKITRDAAALIEQQEAALNAAVAHQATLQAAWQADVDRLTAELTALREAGRWIPVKEKLPYYDVPVLVTYIGFIDKKPYSDGVAKWSLELNGYNGGWVWALDESEVEVEITHWLPLPAAPIARTDQS